MIGNQHALGMISKGVLAGSTIGLSSQGYLIQISEFTYIPPEIPDIETGKSFAGASTRGKKKWVEDDKKVVMVTVKAYGKEITSRHILNTSIKISIGDIEIIEDESGPIGISIRNIHRKS